MDKTVKEYLELRTVVYRLLAFPWYKEPTNEWFVKLRKYIPVFEKLFEERGEDMLKKGVELLREMSGQIDEAKYANIFAYIFLVGNAASGIRAVTPHESVYLSGSGLVKQDEWESVFEHFVSEGIGVEKDFREPEDHISAEMHFLALLSEQAVACMDEDNDRFLQKLRSQTSFLRENISLWVKPLREHMERLTDDPLYLAAANLTAGFIIADTAFIADLTENPEREEPV
ncbi:MAG: molecular chaperone TorD family protein [Deferribacteraceae bacterium]|jgi:TorA-specific chaperone|nr:molecular chaperone TorD family protein [Deferribacteraceae bacterium]